MFNELRVSSPDSLRFIRDLRLRVLGFEYEGRLLNCYIIKLLGTKDDCYIDLLLYCHRDHGYIAGLFKAT
jgi:hypothetical protein